MARSTFGGTTDDSVEAIKTVAGQKVSSPQADITVTFWTAKTGGTQYTDLLDGNGNPVTTITSDEFGQLPEFQGPDGILTMYADAGAGRVRIASSDGAAAAAASASAAAASAASAAAVGTTNDTIIAGQINTAGSATRGATDALYASLPAGALDATEALNVYYKGPTGIAGWTTSNVLVARALGWTIVTDKRYSGGAKNDSTADDRAAIAAAQTATSTGGVLYFPAGSGYLISSEIFGKPGITYKGAGKRASLIKPTSGLTSLRLLNLSNCPNTTVEDLGFDANSNTTVRAGILASDSAEKNLTVQRCYFTGFQPGSTLTTYAALYVFTANKVELLNNEIVDCGRGILVDVGTTKAVFTIAGNRITATFDPVAKTGYTTMSTGIMVRKNGTPAADDVRGVVRDNYVSGAYNDPNLLAAGAGAEGHGIVVTQVRHVKVVNNTCVNNGRGILMSQGSHGGVVTGNECAYNWDSGIRCEPQSATDRTIGTGVARGVVIANNHCHDSGPSGLLTAQSAGYFGQGITVSYGAGCTVVANNVHDNAFQGINTDSTRVTIVGNVVYNNFKGAATDPSGQPAGIQCYGADTTDCVIVGNTCFDNQTVKTQQYGLSLNHTGTLGTRAHVVHGNSFAGNGTAEVFGATYIKQGFYGTPPIAKQTLAAAATDAATTQTLANDLRTKLIALGLFS